MQTIEILVTPQGETQIETKGFIGSSCRHASQFLEQSLGTKLSDQPTAELHQTAATQSGLQQRG